MTEKVFHVIKQDWNTFAIVFNNVPLLMGKRWSALPIIIQAAMGIFPHLKGNPKLLYNEDSMVGYWNEDPRCVILLANESYMIEHYDFSGDSCARASIMAEINSTTIDDGRRPNTTEREHVDGVKPVFKFNYRYNTML